MSVVRCRIERGENGDFQIKIGKGFARNVRNRKTFVERDESDIALSDEFLVVLIRDKIFQNRVRKIHFGNHFADACLLNAFPDEQKYDIRIVRFAGFGEREHVFQFLRNAHVPAEDDDKFSADSVFRLQIFRCGNERLNGLEVFQNVKFLCGNLRIVFFDVVDIALRHAADFVAHAVKFFLLTAEMPVKRPPFFHETEIDGVLREDVAQDEIGLGAAAFFHARDDVCECDGRSRRNDEVEMFPAQMFVDCALVNDGKQNVGDTLADEIYPEQREGFDAQEPDVFFDLSQRCFRCIVNGINRANLVSVACKLFDERSVHIGVPVEIQIRNRKKKNFHGFWYLAIGTWRLAIGNLLTADS